MSEMATAPPGYQDTPVQGVVMAPQGTVLATPVAVGQPVTAATTLVVVQAPGQQSMEDNPKGSALGYGGFGKNIAQNMSDPYAFKIRHNIPRDGCCWEPNLCFCFPSLKGRGYLIVGENFYESNSPAFCCRILMFGNSPVCIPISCCSTKDNIDKIYFDRQPFAETCCEAMCNCCLEGGSFVTEKDTSFCCFCIPTLCCYDLCTRPCHGGFVARSSSKRGTCCFNCETRCCQCCLSTIAKNVESSEKTMEIFQESLDTFRAKGGGDFAMS